MQWRRLRNLIAFWLFGICTDFAYIVMLSGAEDIINEYDHRNSTALGFCEKKLQSRRCASVSTGAILLADIIPMILIKATLPFYMEKVPIDVRHIIIIVVQCAAYLLVALSKNITVALTGVVLASFSSGLGEASYIAFTSYFGRSSVSTWSSGTGGASLFGSLSYAGLTEPHFADISPKTTLLIMLCVPVILALTYSFLLKMPKSIYRIKLYDPRTWMVPQWYLDGQTEKKKIIAGSKIVPDQYEDNGNAGDICAVRKTESFSEYCYSQRQLSFVEKLKVTRPLLKYMIALTTVYFAEYLINQGLVELIIFDCSHGFKLAQTSQYRWYQVIYQAGVFISRSTSSFYEMPEWLLFALPVLQLLNAVFFFMNAMYFFLPHIGIVFALILFEGLIGGSSYVNTYKRVYANAEPDVREFSLAMASLADAFGIVVSGFLAIPIHNYVCDRSLP